LRFLQSPVLLRLVPVLERILLVAVVVRKVLVVIVRHAQRSLRPDVRDLAVGALEHPLRLPRLLFFGYRPVARLQHEPLLVSDGRLVRQQHRRGAEHVREWVVEKIEVRCRVQIRVPHHLQ
jgi:hypothetical protein